MRGAKPWLVKIIFFPKIRKIIRSGAKTSGHLGYSFFVLAGNYARGDDLKGFGTFCDTIFTPKEWFLSKKGPKEGERVARGHFHERVGETLYIGYHQALELPQNLSQFQKRAI